MDLGLQYEIRNETLEPAGRVRRRIHWDFVLSSDPDRSTTDRLTAALPASSLRKGLGLFVQIAGLLATAWVVWITTVAPKLHYYSWARLVQTAFGYALFAWLWSLAITFGLYLAIPRQERRDVLAGTLRTS